MCGDRLSRQRADARVLCLTVYMVRILLHSHVETRKRKALTGVNAIWGDDRYL